MTPFATRASEDRATYVQEAATRLGVSAVIVEKDFWVCWLLGRIFEVVELAPHVVFKGGTSLSKVYGAIRRFSEDIGVSVSPALLGCAESDLDDAPSSSQRQKRFQKLEEACADWVRNPCREALVERVCRELGKRPGGKEWLTYQLDPLSKSPLLLFDYPSTLPPAAGYISPVVKLEFGSLTDQQPRGKHAIKPLLADVFPTACEDGCADVVALEVERTFWEKVTILHAEYYRPPEQPVRDRWARHYADTAALWRHPAKDLALARLDLLERVATHKGRFFASSWAKYQDAKPGTLRLCPPERREGELARDYQSMQAMFIEPPPAFSEVLRVLAEAEEEINRL